MQARCDAARGSKGKACDTSPPAATTAPYNPNFPFPPRPPHAPGFAPMRAPIGCLWRPSIQCGPPLVLPAGAALPPSIPAGRFCALRLFQTVFLILQQVRVCQVALMSRRLSGYEDDSEGVSDEDVPAPPAPRQPHAAQHDRTVCKWVHGSAAALAAAQRAVEEDEGSAAKAAEAAAAEADDEDANVATKAFVPAAPDSRRRRMPSAIVLAARANAAAVAAAAVAAPATPATARGEGSDAVKEAASAAEDEGGGVELAAGAFLVRLQWRHSGGGVGVAASDGDVLVARCASAEVAQVGLHPTDQPYCMVGSCSTTHDRTCRVQSSLLMTVPGLQLPQTAFHAFRALI